MLINKIKSTSIILLLILPFSVLGQGNELNKFLSEKENKKIASADKLIKKGSSIIDETKIIEDEMSALKNADGRIKTRKINKLNKKVAEQKLKAAVFFEDGYAKHIKVLDKRLKNMEKSGDAKAGSIRDEADDLEKKARKQFSKSERLSSPDEMVELVELAQENQNKAIALQEGYLLGILANVPTEEPVEELTTAIAEVADTTTVQMDEVAEEQTTEQDSTNMTVPQSIPSAVASNPVSGGTGAIVAGAGVATVALQSDDSNEPTSEETTVPVEEEINQTVEEVVPAVPEEVQKEIGDVFLSIQILADKEKVAPEKLSETYSGSLKIIEKIGNGWHRYSVGQFLNVEEAKQTMKNEGIKGFIVAYNKDERISVKEALDLIVIN